MASNDNHPATDIKRQTYELARLKFFWGVWTTQARIFSRRMVIAGLVLLILILLETDAVTIDLWAFRWNQMPFDDRKMFDKFVVCPLGWCTLVWTFFSMVNLMRHRVPEDLEPLIHNDAFGKRPMPGVDDRDTMLRLLDQGLQLLLALGFLSSFGLWMMALTWAAFRSQPTIKELHKISWWSDLILPILAIVLAFVAVAGFILRARRRMRNP
jgi:hypothetical protein